MRVNKKIMTRICVSAVMAALSVIFAYIAKSIFGSGPLRLTFENLPIFIVSMAYGPIFGGLCGVVADLCSCLISGMAPIPFITVGAFAVGFVSGLVFLIKMKKPLFSIIISVFSGHLIGSIVIKTIVLYGFYGPLALYRIPIYIGITAVESILLFLLVKRKSVRSVIQSAGGNIRYEF